MRRIPTDVVNYLAELVIEKKTIAYLVADREGMLSGWGGNLGRYDIPKLRKGLTVGEQVYFLEGLLPADPFPIKVPFVRVTHEAFFDIHILRVESRDWILLLDTSLEADAFKREGVDKNHPSQNNECN